MFELFVVKPLFNLLVAIYALLPGHNFGIALIVFTVIVRLALWPLVKKQLHQTKITRELQPELKRIKKEAAGDKQKESMMMLELYKEKGVNPLGSLPVLIVQMVVLIGLYTGLNKVIKDPSQIYHFAYGFLQHLGWLKDLAHDVSKFDNTLFGLVDLARPAIGKEGFYLPAFLLVAASATMQFITSKQALPTSKDAPKFGDILRQAGEGKPADASDMNAAVGRTTIYIIPLMVFFFTVNLAAALSLYWFVGSLVAYFQQRAVLERDTEELEAIADTGDSSSKRDISRIQEAEIIATPPTKKHKKKKSSKKRRR
jgi:YidC/Oxa1 family membrane protein insertase